MAYEDWGDEERGRYMREVVLMAERAEALEAARRSGELPPVSAMTEEEKDRYIEGLEGTVAVLQARLDAQALGAVPVELVDGPAPGGEPSPGRGVRALRAGASVLARLFRLALSGV